MFCVKCGNEIPDESAFCPKCGAEVKKPKVTDAADRQGELPNKEESGQLSGAAEPSEQEGSTADAKPKRKKKGIAIAAACLVVIAAIGVGVWWHFAHAEHLVTVAVDASGTGEGSTPIPVKVSGTDACGGTVDEYRFVEPGAMDIMVLPGSYDFSFDIGYVTSDVHAAFPPATTIHVEVGLFDDAQKELGETVPYYVREDDEVTEAQMEKIYEAAAQNPNDGGKAQVLCSQVLSHGTFMKAAKTNAKGFLMSVFDTKNNAAKNRSVGQFVTKGKYIQTGSGLSTVTELKVTMESDSKVSYSLHYTYEGPYGTAGAADAKGYLGIASDGKVDSWYAEGSTRNSLYG